MAGSGLQLEPLHIQVSPLLLIEESGCPHLVGVILLNACYVVLIVVVGIEVGDVEVGIVQYHQYLVVIVELAQVGSLLVVVETMHVEIEPYLPAAQRASAVALECDAAHIQLGEQIAHALTALDGQQTEVAIKEDLLHLGVGLEHHLDCLGLSIGVGCEVEHTAPGLSLRQVILTVAGDAGHIEAFHV